MTISGHTTGLPIGMVGDSICLLVATGDRTLPTVNNLLGRHWSHYHRVRDTWGQATADAVLEAKLGRVRWDRARFNLTPLYPEGYAKDLPDTGAVFACTKPIVDQLVAAEIIPDDNRWHSAGELHWPPAIDTTMGLKYSAILVVIENMGDSEAHDCTCRRTYLKKQLGAHGSPTSRRKRQ